MASSRKSRGTRIEEENLGGLPVIRLMSMTKNDNLRPEDTPSAVEGRRKMMRVAAREFMNHKDSAVSEFELYGSGEVISPLGDIAIAADGRYRSNGAEFIQNHGLDNIPSMENHIYSTEFTQYFRVKNIVSIRDNTYFHLLWDLSRTLF